MRRTHTQRDSVTPSVTVPSPLAKTVVTCKIKCLQNVLRRLHVKQESLAHAKVSARQQCVYEGPWLRNL